MCYEFNAEPPIAAIGGAAVDSEDLTLESRDGTKFAAFAARAENPSGGRRAFRSATPNSRSWST